MRLDNNFSLIDVKKSKRLWENFEILLPQDGLACKPCMFQIYAMLKNVKDDDEEAKEISHKNLKHADAVKSSKKISISEIIEENLPVRRAKKPMDYKAVVSGKTND